MPISSRASLPKSGRKGPRKSSSLPAETVDYLKAWMMSPEHIAHPYPTEPEKAQIMADTGIELKQLTNWFVNNRKRYWKPRVEARLQQQARAAAAAAQAHAAAVAVATASVHTATNPVSPEQGYKPTLSLAPPPASGFVTFDLHSPRSLPLQSKRRVSSSSLPQLVETDVTRILSDANTYSDERIVVSESSSSGSVTASEEGDDVTAEEDETTSSSAKADAASSQQEQQTADEQDYSSSQQTTGESSSSVSIASTLACASSLEDGPAKKKKRVLEYSSSSTMTITTPRKKFRRVSIELWRETCQNAGHIHDEALPSLEEATQLFGYSQ